MVYVRELADPKWTYEVIGQDPVFNPSASDYQDFELPIEEAPNLISIILQMAGVSIRDLDLLTAENNNEALKLQKQNL